MSHISWSQPVITLGQGLGIFILSEGESQAVSPQCSSSRKWKELETSLLGDSGLPVLPHPKLPLVVCKVRDLKNSQGLLGAGKVPMNGIVILNSCFRK